MNWRKLILKKLPIKPLKLLLLLLSTFLLTACDKEEKITPNLTDYNQALTQGRGTIVSFYGWGGDEDLNKWIDTSLAPSLKEKYDITLDRVPMNIEDVLSKLSGEKQGNVNKGSIDMIWLNGENFSSAKANNLLYGSFTQLLPNFKTYINPDDKEVNFDFGSPIEGYEAPYSKAQLVLMNDSAITAETPKNTDELLAFAKKYKGKVTYAALPDFTGSAFVRNIIYDICGYEQFMDMEADKEVVKKAIEPALAYLRTLNPYLWKEGTTFPSTSNQVDQMYADGELYLNMSYNAYSIALGIEKGTYSDTTRSFLFDNGTIGNTNYISIAYNAPNPSGAMIAINEILSAHMQSTKFETTKAIPVIDNSKLSADEKKLFDDIEIGKGALDQKELLHKRLPEMPADLVPIIEEIWFEEVVGK